MNLPVALACTFLVSFPTTQVFGSYSDCGSLVGTYVPAGGSTQYSQIRIALDVSHVVISYNDPDGPNHDGYRLNLIPDGSEHPGDDPMNEGKSYTATCAPNQLIMVRNGLLNAPLTTVMELHDSQFLNYTDKIEGHPSENYGQYLKTN